MARGDVNRKASPEALIRDFEPHLTRRQRRWLETTNPVRRWTRRAVHRLVRRIMRLAFSIETLGAPPDRLGTPVIFAPNHSSSLDSLFLAAALEADRFERTRFAVRRGVVLGSALRRLGARFAGVVPIRRDVSALAAGAAILAHDYDLVWYPEGTRTRDGELGPFKAGIGLLLEHGSEAVAIPVYLEGAFEVLRPGQWWPRRRAVRVHFGEPVGRSDPAWAALDAEPRVDRMIETLRDRLVEMQARTKALA